MNSGREAACFFRAHLLRRSPLIQGANFWDCGNDLGAVSIEKVEIPTKNHDEKKANQISLHRFGVFFRNGKKDVVKIETSCRIGIAHGLRKPAQYS